MISRRSSGCISAESAVEPTRSENITRLDGARRCLRRLCRSPEAGRIAALVHPLRPAKWRCFEQHTAMPDNCDAKILQVLHRGLLPVWKQPVDQLIPSGSEVEDDCLPGSMRHKWQTALGSRGRKLSRNEPAVINCFRSAPWPADGGRSVCLLSGFQVQWKHVEQDLCPGWRWAPIASGRP